ncbi:MAG: hypothetical protein GF408_05700 [Candidatus Omnitrophica bacterium]|nr:hypothetical protein [Candidatus Omnitrophota bacterium]
MADISTAAVIVASIVFALATFVDINVGLIAILLSMLLSPELELGQAGGRAVVIRAEDLLLIIVSFTWLAKMAVRKGTPFVRHSPLNVPIALYTAILCFSTAKGIMMGDVYALKGMFYVFKLIEYFILYFIVINHVTRERQVKLFLIVLFFTSIVVAIYGITHLGSVERISAPFEGEGEPNTLGGYMLFIISLVAGLIYHYRSKRLLLVLMFIFLIPTFVFTLSRASYLGMFAALFAFAGLSRDKRIINASLVLLLLFMGAVVFGPPVLKDRVIGAFKPEESQSLKKVGAISLGPSPAARIESWQNLIQKRFPKRPLLGWGVTGTEFLDSQYFLVLGETGIVGLGAFLWLMWSVWKGALYSYRHVEKPLYKGLSMGFMVGFSGLLLHAVGSNTFIIIRIAEPFWFFAAIVLKLVDIEHGTAVLKDKVPSYMKGRA